MAKFLYRCLVVFGLIAIAGHIASLFPLPSQAAESVMIQLSEKSALPIDRRADMQADLHQLLLMNRVIDGVLAATLAIGVVALIRGRLNLGLIAISAYSIGVIWFLADAWALTKWGILSVAQVQSFQFVTSLETGRWLAILSQAFRLFSVGLALLGIAVSLHGLWRSRFSP